MPSPTPDVGLWAKLWSTLYDHIYKTIGFSSLVTAAAVVWVLLSLPLVWFTVRAMCRRRPADPDALLRRLPRILTSTLAAFWYLKGRLVPEGVRQWTFGELVPGVPSDNQSVSTQEEDARAAAMKLLTGGHQIVVFTGPAGWGKTYTSHHLKKRLDPLAQVDVSWTMISSDPEVRIVEEFAKELKEPALAGGAIVSFDDLDRLALGHRATVSPHFFIHVHDFEAIAVESRSLAAARRLIGRVLESNHVSLIITTRDKPETLLTRLPVLDGASVDFVEIKPLRDADITTLLGNSPDVSRPSNASSMSPLELILWRHLEGIRKAKSQRGERRETKTAPSGGLTDLYQQLFSHLAPSQQAALQLLLARLAVSPERLFLREPDRQLLAPLFHSDSRLRLFAYVEGHANDAVARLAHPTVLKLYADTEIMDEATRKYRHGQWSDALPTSQDCLATLQLVRHHLRAGRGRPEHEELITSASYGQTLAICRFLFECRSDFHECFPEIVARNGRTAAEMLLEYDGTQEPEEYRDFVAVLLGPPATLPIWNVTLKNLAKMMELLYQGLDAGDAAEVVAKHLAVNRAPWTTYGLAMQAMIAFDSRRATKSAIDISKQALEAWSPDPNAPVEHLPFALATIRINHGVLQNNQFGKDDEGAPEQFNAAGASYEEAGRLIRSEMDREPRAEYRLLMLREWLRAASGRIRWTYLSKGAEEVNVAQDWKSAKELVGQATGWPSTTLMQELAYFALNASFIDLARYGPSGKWRDYYAHAEQHQEAAGDVWFRLRLDQMRVVRDTLDLDPDLDRDSDEMRDGRRVLESVIAEMRRIGDWTGVAFCSYQLSALGAKTVERREVEARYTNAVQGAKSPSTFADLTKQERLFDILCGPWTRQKARYFPSWDKTPMPLNLQGLLLLRSVSLLDQANWDRSGA